MKQQINDGIRITQGDLKKHEDIDWNNNPNLNPVTKTCLNYFQGTYSFEEYLDERSKKDSKFVNLHEEERNINSVNTQNS
jgi:hypothetical protein